jgi:hypothetical protein
VICLYPSVIKKNSSEGKGCSSAVEYKLSQARHHIKQNKNKNIALPQARWHALVIPGSWEAEAGGSLKPRSLGPAWAA